MTKLLPAVLFFSVTATLLTAGPAQAQLSMSVAPVRVEHAIAPDETWTDIVMVENVSDRTLYARVTVADWFLERDGTPVFVKRGRHPELSMSDWVEVNPTELAVPPGATQPVRYTVTVPSGVPDASYRTALLIESLPDFAEVARARNANVAYLTARIGVIVYNRIGSATPEAQIVNQQVIASDTTLSGQAVELTVRNPGLVNLRITGSSELLGPLGQTLQTHTIPDSVILPRSERSIVVALEEPITTAGFTVLSRLDIGHPPLLEVETQVGRLAANHGVLDD